MPMLSRHVFDAVYASAIAASTIQATLNSADGCCFRSNAAVFDATPDIVELTVQPEQIGVTPSLTNRSTSHNSLGRLFEAARPMVPSAVGFWSPVFTRPKRVSTSKWLATGSAHVLSSLSYVFSSLASTRSIQVLGHGQQCASARRFRRIPSHHLHRYCPRFHCLFPAQHHHSNHHLTHVGQNQLERFQRVRCKRNEAASSFCRGAA
jgi:hypothetical protein